MTNNQLSTSSMRAIDRWIQDEHVSYFDVRRFLASFDLGFPFLIRGEWSLAAQKLARLGKIDNRVAYLDSELPTPQNSVALVVTFNPDSSVLANLIKIGESFSKVVIVDNSPSEVKSLFEELDRALPGRFIFSYHGNRFGLSGALNQGLRVIFKMKTSGWMFTFDQDSTLFDGFVRRLEKLLQAETTQERNESLYGVEYEDERIRTRNQKNGLITEEDTVITSGSFMRVENLRRVGIYIDELFIDSLDHEYCLRARRLGMKVKKIRAKLMKHKLGNPQIIDCFNREIFVTHHPVFRWFYFFRNFIFTGLEGLPSSLLWTLSHGFSLGKNFIKMLVFEKNKTAKTMAVLKGSFSGFRLFLGLRKKDLKI